MELTKENQCNRYLQLVRLKIKRELAKGHKFDTQDAESFIISYGIYDIERFNFGNKGDNFDRYMNESINKDFLDFINKEYQRVNRIEFSLDEEVEGNEGEITYKFNDVKALKYEDIGSMSISWTPKVEQIMQIF